MDNMDRKKKFDLPPDWDVVHTDSAESSVSSIDTQDEALPDENVAATETKEPEPGIEEIEQDDRHAQSDSSDIDVIEDEAMNDDMETSRMTFNVPPNMGDSTNSMGAEEPENIDDAPEPQPRRSSWMLPFFGEFLRYVADYMMHRLTGRDVALALLTITLTVKLTLPGSDKSTLVRKLERENWQLKSEVLSKTVDIKMFDTLEELIKSLRSENSKLSTSLQSMIGKMEEQNYKRHKENMQKSDPYKKEIEKLKEQVNILITDNEELQQQLVRMRYGPQGNEQQKDEEKAGPPFAMKDYNKETLLQMRRSVLEELENVKLWEKATFQLLEALEKQEKEKYEHQYEEFNKQHYKEPFEDPKNDEMLVTKPQKEFPKAKETDNEKMQKKKEDTTQQIFKESDREKGGKHAKKSEKEYHEHKGSKKDRKKFKLDFSWRNIKRQLKETYQSLKKINISELFTANKAQVKGMLESVGVYLGKIEDEAFRMVQMFNPDTDSHNDDAGEDTRKSWSDVKKESFRKNVGESDDSREEGMADNEFKEETIYEYPQNDNLIEVHPDSLQNYANDKHIIDSLERSASSEDEPGLDSLRDWFKEHLPNYYDENGVSWFLERAKERERYRKKNHRNAWNWFLKRNKDGEVEEDDD